MKLDLNILCVTPSSSFFFRMISDYLPLTLFKNFSSSSSNFLETSPILVPNNYMYDIDSKFNLNCLKKFDWTFHHLADSVFFCVCNVSLSLLTSIR